MPASVLELARGRLLAAERVVALCGAGVSAESGVPTFRCAGGLWQNHRPEELATPQAFARDPALVWRWYHWRRELISKCRPNPAHMALAEMERRLPGFTLVTQNVDGLHRLAGSRAPLEIHGNIWFVRCLGCGERREERRLDLPVPPRCPSCGGLLRPDVVWFGESLDQGLLERAWRAAEQAQVMLVVGTSAVVQPAASLARVAKQAGAYLIEVNLEDALGSGQVDASLRGKAGQILPALVEAK